MGESILSGGLNTFESQKMKKRKGSRSRFLDNHDIEEEDGDTTQQWKVEKEGLGENKWIVFEEFSFLFNLCRPHTQKWGRLRTRKQINWRRVVRESKAIKSSFFGVRKKIVKTNPVCHKNPSSFPSNKKRDRWNHGYRTHDRSRSPRLKASRLIKSMWVREVGKIDS